MSRSDTKTQNRHKPAIIAPYEEEDKMSETKEKQLTNEPAPSKADQVNLAGESGIGKECNFDYLLEDDEGEEFREDYEEDLLIK